MPRRSCEAIGAFCIGTNQVDLTTAATLGIPVFNAPFSNTRSVVELVIARSSRWRAICTDKNAGMHAGVWDKSAKAAHEVRRPHPRHRRLRQHRQPALGRRRVARHAGLLLRRRQTSSRSATRRRCETLDELLEVAETVSLASSTADPATQVSSAPSNSRRCAAGVVFLNLCRGFVVDHEALREHLLSGHIAGRCARRIRRRAQERWRSIQHQPARPAQRDLDAAHRRLDRGGADRYRPVRGRQACATSPTAGTPRCRSICPRCRPKAAWPDAAGAATSTRTSPACWQRVNGLLANAHVNIESQECCRPVVSWDT